LDPIQKSPCIFIAPAEETSQDEYQNISCVVGLGWKQVDLAAAISVDFSYPIEQSDISEIERGVRGVRDFELKYFSEVLGVSSDWLLGGSSDDSSSKE